MTFISYAQNFEDVMLWRALKDVSDGFYIDVGAFSPTVESVTKAFYDRGWHGINIEPNPVFHSKLKAERARDVNLQVAIGSCPRLEELKVIESTGLTTLSDEIAAKHVASGWGQSRVKVRVETLAEIISAHVPRGREIHFLKIDVEGLEEEVIRSGDFRTYRPWIVVVEATRPTEQHLTALSWEGHLLAEGYVFVYFDGLNRFYVSEEKRELAKTFSVPPNVFDNFIQVRSFKQLVLLAGVNFTLAFRMSKLLRWQASRAS